MNKSYERIAFEREVLHLTKKFEEHSPNDVHVTLIRNGWLDFCALYTQPVQEHDKAVYFNAD